MKKEQAIWLVAGAYNFQQLYSRLQFSLLIRKHIMKAWANGELSMSLYNKHIVLLVICAMYASNATAQNIESNESWIRGGDETETDEYEAVGLVFGRGQCSGTLISDTTVLSAGHCFCAIDDSSADQCTSSATFRFTNVNRVDDPSTLEDESVARGNVSIGGTVSLHPSRGSTGWLSWDFGTITLERPASEIVRGIRPIPVALPQQPPKVGDQSTLVGYGFSNSECTTGSGTKRKVSLPINQISTDNITLRYGTPIAGACPGDSGGPALNQAGVIVGVASTGPGNYDPTWQVYDWLYGIGQIRAKTGAVAQLRVQEMGDRFGPPTDFINAELIVQLANSPIAFGLGLADDNTRSAHKGSLKILRKAFETNARVRVEYSVNGPTTGRIIRVVRVLP